MVINGDTGMKEYVKKLKNFKIRSVRGPAPNKKKKIFLVFEGI